MESYGVGTERVACIGG